jgi:murein L,D-transpeptidase YcbB/YkuD
MSNVSGRKPGDEWDEFHTGFTGQDPQRQRIKQVEGSTAKGILPQLFERYKTFLEDVTDRALGRKKSPEEMTDEEAQKVLQAAEVEKNRGNAPPGFSMQGAPGYGQQTESMVEEAEQQNDLELVFERNTTPKQDEPVLEVTSAAFGELPEPDEAGNVFEFSEDTPNVQHESIKRIQTALKGMGYDIGEEGVDGYLGTNTASAVRQFQEDTGLEVTGNIDTQTLRALERESQNGLAGRQ